MVHSVKWSILAMALILSIAGGARAERITIEISALIDGRDQLIIRANMLQ
jgi:hypothetical protein